MRHVFAGVTVLIALSVSASATEYTGWYLGAGIGYGTPSLISASQQGECTGSGGRIFFHADKLYCAHKIAEKPAARREIHGQATGFMWQGMSAKPDTKFNDACAKQTGKVSRHADGNWYCDRP